jgi:hypothetical protein
VCVTHSAAAVRLTAVCASFFGKSNQESLARRNGASSLYRIAGTISVLSVSMAVLSRSWIEDQQTRRATPGDAYQAPATAAAADVQQMAVAAGVASIK